MDGCICWLVIRVKTGFVFWWLTKALKISDRCLCLFNFSLFDWFFHLYRLEGLFFIMFYSQKCCLRGVEGIPVALGPLQFFWTKSQLTWCSVQLFNGWWLQESITRSEDGDHWIIQGPLHSRLDSLDVCSVSRMLQTEKVQQPFHILGRIKCLYWDIPEVVVQYQIQSWT